MDWSVSRPVETGLLIPSQKLWERYAGSFGELNGDDLALSRQSANQNLPYIGGNRKIRRVPDTSQLGAIFSF